MEAEHRLNPSHPALRDSTSARGSRQRLRPYASRNIREALSIDRALRARQQLNSSRSRSRAQLDESRSLSTHDRDRYGREGLDAAYADREFQADADLSMRGGFRERLTGHSSLSRRVPSRGRLSGVRSSVGVSRSRVAAARSFAHRGERTVSQASASRSRVYSESGATSRSARARAKSSILTSTKQSLATSRANRSSRSSSRQLSPQKQLNRPPYAHARGSGGDGRPVTEERHHRLSYSRESYRPHTSPFGRKSKQLNVKQQRGELYGDNGRNSRSPSRVKRSSMVNMPPSIAGTFPASFSTPPPSARFRKRRTHRLPMSDGGVQRKRRPKSAQFAGVHSNRSGQAASLMEEMYASSHLPRLASSGDLTRSLSRCDTLGSFGGMPIYSNDVDEDLLKFADRLFISKCQVSLRLQELTMERPPSVSHVGRIPA